MRCVYCDRPLQCRECEAEFEPRTREQYEAMARAEVPVLCPGCEAVLVCRWCRMPYDGEAEGGEERSDGG